MNRICIAALMTVMICASGCGPSEQEEQRQAAKLQKAKEKDAQRQAILAQNELDRKLFNALPEITGGKLPRVEYIRRLISEGADVNAERDYTSLMKAARHSNTTEIVTVLIEAGADVNARDYHGQTPLMFAVGRYYPVPEVVTLLIESGAYVHARDKQGKTLLMEAADNSWPTPEVVTLLIEAGADVNIETDDGKTALWFADDREIIKLLKAAGAKE
jgi:ankyrin repeat protein